MVLAFPPFSWWGCALVAVAPLVWLAERVAARSREGDANEDARRRLAQIIREGLERPKARRKTKPTRGSIERRLKAKAGRSQVKKMRGVVENED